MKGNAGIKSLTYVNFTTKRNAIVPKFIKISHQGSLDEKLRKLPQRFDIGRILLLLCHVYLLPDLYHYLILFLLMNL